MPDPKREETYEERKARLKEFFFKQGYFPSFSEMMHLFAVKTKSSISLFLEKMMAEGALFKKHGKYFLTDALMLDMYESVDAGIATGARDEVKYKVNVQDTLITNPLSQFLVKVAGESMVDAWLIPGDILIVDRKKVPQIGDIVIAYYDEEGPTVKYYCKERGKAFLRAANTQMFPYDIIPYRKLEVQGVVTGSFRTY